MKINIVKTGTKSEKRLMRDVDVKNGHRVSLPIKGYRMVANKSGNCLRDL